MDSDTRAMIVTLGFLFLVIFGGLSIAALSTAELNYATILTGGASLFICVAVLIGLINAIRNPPDE